MNEPVLDRAPNALPAHLPPSLRAAVESAVALVGPDLAASERRLGELLESDLTIIPRVGGHLAFAGGKRFRPLLTLLAAKAAGVDDQARITVAAVAELLHTATLLHDDVIDEGEWRRGRPAARMPYGNGMAVLTGDYCLARGLQAMARTGHIDAVQTMADAVTLMAEGEVAQLHGAGDWELDRDRYYQVIERKTAALIAWCTMVAGLAGPELSVPLHEFGLEVGRAFQIADDVIDYRSDVGTSGKARGQDLREGKLTLPILLAFEERPELRGKLRDLLADGPPAPTEAFDALVDEVSATRALERATIAAEDHSRRAAELLLALPPSPARDALEGVAYRVARRDT